MSILSALKQEGSSIDELAKLPQAMIMQMAQKKQLGAEMVAPILARKAEMADAVARTRALKQAGAPMPTVMEQLMQKNAEAEQPEPDAREMGVAQLPIDEGMYDEQRMASGGIVAFAGGGDTNVYEDTFNDQKSYYEQLKEYLNGLQFNAAIPRQGAAVNATPTQIQNAIYGRNTPAIPEGPEPQVATGYKDLPKTFVESQQTDPAEIGLKALANKNAPVKAGTKAQSPLQKTTDAPEATENKQSDIDALLAKYEKMIMGSPEEAAKAKKQALWSRLTEAGLGIMGGTSTNFAENVGKGATQAMKGYAEDIKGLRAEETAKLNQLVSLGLKGASLKQEAKKLGITEKRYDQWYKAQMAQVGETAATRREIAGERADTAKANRMDRANTAMENRIKGLTDSLLKLPKYTDNPELAYADATRMVTGKSAEPTFTGFSGRSLN